MVKMKKNSLKILKQLSEALTMVKTKKRLKVNNDEQNTTQKAKD